MHIDQLHTHLRGLEGLLRDKLGRDYLVNVVLKVDNNGPPHLWASAWHRDQSRFVEKKYVFQFDAHSPNIKSMLLLLEGEIRSLELWTPEAIAKTLGIAS